MMALYHNHDERPYEGVGPQVMPLFLFLGTTTTEGCQTARANMEPHSYQASALASQARPQEVAARQPADRGLCPNTF